LQFAHDVERFMPFLGLEPIDGQHHRLHVRIRGGQLVWSLAAGRQHLLVAVNIGLDRVGGQANLVYVGQFGTELPDRPVAGKAALAQPTYHIPAEDPPRHGDRGLSFWTDRVGMGWAGACGAMCQLADQMQRPVEREHPMMAMVTRSQRASTCPAPPLFDYHFDACEPRVFWPAVWHDGPLLVQDVLGNYPPIAVPIGVLAFCRTVVFNELKKELKG